MGRPGGQLERSLAALTIGVQQGNRFRDRALADGRTGEYTQQIRELLTGEAGSDWGYVDTPVVFEYPFLWAPLQRRVDFATPHFSYGIEFVKPSAILVTMHAHVVNWDINDSSWVIGAMIRFAVAAPLADVTPVSYRAIAHLTFQGYAAYAEGGEFDS